MVETTLLKVFERDLEEHELMHASTAREAAQSLVSRIAALGPCPNEVILGARIEELAKATGAAAHQRDEGIDGSV